MTRPFGPHDRYRAERLLGEGGSGRVWLVEDRLHPGTRLALKELFVAGADPDRESRLRHEFATLACLRHPNLVEVHEFDTSESGRPRFSLEWIEGRDIVETVRDGHADLFLQLTVEALRALAFLHDFGLLHGDLKPANLLVRDRAKLGCRLVLVDFGLARPSIDSTRDPAARGTLPYLAPEIFRGQGATRRSDLYGLGAVLVETVTGEPPFRPRGSDLTAFIEAVSSGRRKRLPLRADYPGGLRGWLDELLDPDPAGRPATAAAALARLNAACGTERPLDTPVSRAARLMSGPPAERERDIERIWQNLDPSGGARVVWLCGDPGSGKSRVLRWLEADAVRKGWHVFAPGTATPGLADLRESAAAGPTLFLLDDLDSASARILDTVERLARERGQAPVQAVAALRPAGSRQPSLSRLLQDTGIVPSLRRVDLAPLDAAGVRAMATRAAGAGVSDERVGWLLEASEGSPAIVESLLIDGEWERGAPQPAPGSAAPLPSGRLDILSDDARRWLDALVVIGEGAEESEVAELTGFDAERAAAAAHETSAAGLAFRRRGRWLPESRSLAEHLRSNLDPRPGADLHSRAAVLLERTRGQRADPWMMSRLRHRSGDLDGAAELAARAAEQAAAQGDPARAAERFAAALRLRGRRLEGRYELRMQQGEALLRSGRHRAAARAFGAATRLASGRADQVPARIQQALTLARAGAFERALRAVGAAERIAARESGSAHLARCRKVKGIVLGRLGREREAIPVLEQARDELAAETEPAARAELLHALATCKLRLGRQDAEDDFREAVELYRAADETDHHEPRDEIQRLKAQIGLAVIQARRNAFDEAWAWLERTREAAAEGGYLDVQEAALSQLAEVALDRGRMDRAMDLAEQAADLSLHLGDPNRVLVNRCRVADARIRCGRPDEAVMSLRETLSHSLERVEPDNVDYAHMLLANACIESSTVDDAAIGALLDEVIGRCRTRRKRRAVMMGLVIEMERRARPDCPEAFGPVQAEFAMWRDLEPSDVDSEIRIRASLAEARFHLGRGDADAALQATDRAKRQSSEGRSHAYGAEAAALESQAWSRKGDQQRARRSRETGRELLQHAAEAIEDESVRRDFLGRSALAPLRDEAALAEPRHQARLMALYDMIRVLNSATDPDELLESILDMALRVVRAERGMILLREEGQGTGFAVRLARNLERETESDAVSYSRSIVEAAGGGRSLLTHDAGNDSRFRDLTSVSLYGIRSLMCVPLRSRGRIIGTVYLDSREGGTLFVPDDLRFLEAFADHAALALENTQTRARLEQHNRHLQSIAETRTEFANIVGHCRAMQNVFDLIEKVAASDLPVLIQGKSGTGKELVARAIHFHGSRRQRLFVSENCAAIPETLLESELFGHVRGAFTGADHDRKGLFEQADGGTLLLDEVGDMSAGMQAKLLRVLQEGELRPVGGERPIRVDVRLLTATHRDLAAEAAAGRFREDLLYRLQVLTVELPALRDRPGDIPLLVDHLLTRIARERGRRPPTVDDDVLALLQRYTWPGNVRQLENTLHRLALLAGDGPIGLGAVESDPALRRQLLVSGSQDRPVFSIKLGERDQIVRALAAADGSRTRAARLLGVSRATLYRKLKQHGI